MAEDTSSVQRRPARGRRVPPHDLQAEESLLGAMMLEPEAIATAAGVLRADDFYKPAHSHIFDAVHALYASGQPVDPVTVADELRRNGLLETVGGHQALVDIMSSAPATTNSAGYARIVEEHALLRSLIGVAGEIAEIGYGLPEDVTKALDRAEAMVYEVNQRRVTDSTSKIEDLLGLNLDRLEQLYGRGDAITGVPTGYIDLDELLSGLQPSNLVIVGARPAMGKCVAWDTLVVDPDTGERRSAADLHRAGSAGRPVGVFTLAGTEVVRAAPSAFVDDGVKRVYRVRTATGREVRTTASHPFLTPDGWRPLADLSPGQAVGVPAAIPVFGTAELPSDEVVMLAHLVMAPGAGDDGPRLWTENREVAADIDYRGTRFGVRVVDRRLPGGSPTWDVIAGPDLDALARRHGVAPAPTDRRVPDAVFQLPRDLLARFLNRALGAAAAVWRPQGREPGRLVVSTRSQGLVHDLQHLLLRFGIVSAVRQAVVAIDELTWSAYELVVDRADQLVAVANQIGVLGHEAELGAVVAHARSLSEQRQSVVAHAAGPSAGGTGREATIVADGPGDRAVLWDEIVAIDDEGDEQVFDLTIPDTHNFVADDVFVHNTSFALGMGAHAALHANKPVLLFSLEMGSLELSQRLLSAEARIDSRRVRTGQLSEDDWSRISQAIGRLASAPIWIDDNPNLTVMEIRSKARRLRSQVGDLGMIVVDYLQLMTGRGSAENRQVEVSEMSRGLKILARELECPVVALSQLSRQLELRADKRPMLADLRESGCLTADARVLRADTGAEVTIGELATSGERDIPVWSLDTNLCMVPATMTHAFPTGVKQVFALRLASGREVTASANHPFLTIDGWRRLDELAAGSRIAVPRVVPTPKQAQIRPDAEVALVADGVGRDGRGVPDPVFSLTDEQVGLFLGLLWSAAGDAGAGRCGPRGISYATTSRRLADDLQLLLLRLGIRSTLRIADARGGPGSAVFAPGGASGSGSAPGSGRANGSRSRPDSESDSGSHSDSGERPVYQLRVEGRDDQLAFLDQVPVVETGAVGQRRADADALRRRSASVEANSDADTVPVAVWDRVRRAMAERGIATHRLVDGLGAAEGSLFETRAPTRSQLARVAEIVDDDVVRSLASSDVVWDRVVAVEERGREVVYDATVESTHNFVANGIVVENSIEQDADVVMFIYRDDVYHSDSPDRGQAEIIVAKHRNGPTGVCRLAFLEQFTRFANMAKVD
ncbi:MAG: replicative DNA helicase [Acidimicrobiales bacterium]|nr:replicative DNA helicase [Acidimicrobiales bacterium]